MIEKTRFSEYQNFIHFEISNVINYLNQTPYRMYLILPSQIVPVLLKIYYVNGKIKLTFQFALIKKNLMSQYSLQFESKELEEKYQSQQHKYIEKSAQHLIYILSIGEIIQAFDNIFHVQYVMLFFAISLVLMNAFMFYLIKTKKIDVKIIIFYFNTICITGIIVQIIYVQLQQELDFTQQQIFAQLDIIHQFITLFNFGQSHIISSLIYVLFIISRVYIQISFGYSNLSIAFALFSLFYIIEEYQKAKQRRKQFLKSQRNKLLEQLIKDFIDERVCIIEKDEENVKFIPVIINNKLQDLTKDINLILKQLKLCSYKQSLQQYLYQSIKEKEIMLCYYKNQIYEVTYQRFTLKKCQIFIKIQELYHNQISLINYKELYLKQLNEIQKIKSSYCSRQIKKVQINLFVHWFKKYPFCYRIRSSSINIQYLFASAQFEIIQSDLIVLTINSDKLLIYLLLQQLKIHLQNRKVKIYKMNSGMLIQIQGIIKRPMQECISFINKILFHIGVGDIIFDQRTNQLGLITIKLLDIKDKMFK